MQTIDKFITSHFLYDDSILFGSLPYCWSGFINCILQGILELLILFLYFVSFIKTRVVMVKSGGIGFIFGTD